MFDVATEELSEGDGDAGWPGRWALAIAAAVVAACLLSTPALAKNRQGGELVYAGVNIGPATVVDSLTLDGVAYGWGGNLKYISNRSYGFGFTYNTSTYAYEAIDGSQVDGKLSTATVEVLFPLNFIHEKFDIYYSRAAIYWSALAGLASEAVTLDGKSFSLGVDDSGYAAGVALGMLYSYDLDPRRRQRKFGGLTLGGELRLLKFLDMETTSGEVQLNFTVGYSF